MVLNLCKNEKNVLHGSTLRTSLFCVDEETANIRTYFVAEKEKNLFFFYICANRLTAHPENMCIEI